MNGLEAARDDLAALLAGLEAEVYTYVPESLQPPCAVIQPAAEYVTTGDEDATYAPDEYLVTQEVWLLVDLVSNEAAADDLDGLLAALLAAVGPSVWWVKSVGQPGPVHTSEWLSHGLAVQVSRFTTL